MLPLALLDAEDDADRPRYKRSDLLRFAVESKGCNKDIIRSIQAGHEKIEDPSVWENFDNWVDHEATLADGAGLELITWLVYHFSPAVVMHDRLKPAMKEWGTVSLGSWLTIDDLAFIVLTLEHSINKWIGLHALLQKKKQAAEEQGQDPDAVDELSKEEVKIVPGNKFRPGSGVSGLEGQARFKALKLYFHKNYYSGSAEARKNEEALKNSLVQYMELQQAKNPSQVDDGNSGTDDVVSGIRSIDEQKFQDMCTMEWQMYGDEPTPFSV